MFFVCYYNDFHFLLLKIIDNQYHINIKQMHLFTFLMILFKFKFFIAFKHDMFVTYSKQKK